MVSKEALTHAVHRFLYVHYPLGKVCDFCTLFVSCLNFCAEIFPVWFLSNHEFLLCLSAILQITPEDYIHQNFHFSNLERVF